MVSMPRRGVLLAPRPRRAPGQGVDDQCLGQLLASCAEIGGAFGGEKETGGGRESGSDAW